MFLKFLQKAQKNFFKAGPSVSQLPRNCYSINHHSTSKFKIDQISSGSLGEFVYYIESNGEACFIDPLRHTKWYKEYLAQHKTNLKYVCETHFHEDFISGHLDLRQITGAEIVYGPTANPNFPAKIAQDGEEIQVGDIKLRVLHTPGHTLESSSFLLLDHNNKPNSLFTGDTLLLGDVGRPYMTTKSQYTKEEMASMLYTSIHDKILALPDDVSVYPGHGLGAAVEKALSKNRSDTLGNQRKLNRGLRKMSKDEFIEYIIKDSRTPLTYFSHDRNVNMRGYAFIDDMLKKVMKPLKVEEFKKIVSEGVTIIDCRDIPDFAEGHIPKSINIPLRVTMPVWVGKLIDPKTKIVLVTEPGKEKEALLELLELGYENMVGYLENGIEAWINDSNKLATLDIVKPVQLRQAMSTSDVQIIDVRNPDEWKFGTVKGAKLIPLAKLEANMKSLDKKRKIFLYCKHGRRSAIASSLMRKCGFENSCSVEGGFYRMASEDIELQNAPYQSSTMTPQTLDSIKTEASHDFIANALRHVEEMEILEKPVAIDAASTKRI
jgi:glyoxylase-like metal-dependent hydrolase (beta-lactamase superfamily II)/rhodanese-related sulfurtransferase